MKKFFLIALIVLFPLTILAKDFSSEISHINAAGFPRIEVLLKVFNKKAEILKADNFAISEDSTPISSFKIEPQKCKHYMILVIDRSSSIKPAMKNVKNAAASFVNSMIENVSMSVLSFGSDLDYNHRFSTDGKSLVEAIYKIRPYGGTALFDAIYSACEELQNKAGRNDLKTIVCLTDGRDSTPNGKTPLSIHTTEQINKFATDKMIRIITVGLGNDIDEISLKKISSASGGWYLKTTSPGQLSKLYEALSRRMKLEKRYRLSYSTPEPEPDGTKRTVEISSQLKGMKDQGKGHYNAPTKVVSIPSPNSQTGKGGRESLTMTFLDLHIDGPDSIFLTRPIIPPPSSPVIGPNSANFLNTTPEESQAIVIQARARLAREHEKNYKAKQKHLDEHIAIINKLQKLNDEKAASPDLKDFERPRIDYRNKYLQFRREEVNLHSQHAYEEYQISFKASMDEMDYYQKLYVQGEPEDDNFLSTNTASESAALRVIESKFQKLYDDYDTKRSEHFSGTLYQRGANVEISEHEKTYDLGETFVDDDIAGPGHSIKDIKNYIKENTSGYNDDDTDEENYDDTYPSIPNITPLD